MSLEKMTSQIRFEIEQIDRLFESYPELLKRVQKEEPNLVEITALGSIVHSFYNGVENIFLSVSKLCDKAELTGARWHQDLLIQMTQETQERKAVLSIETQQSLKEYLGFRHFYRHSYSYFLDWKHL